MHLHFKKLAPKLAANLARPISLMDMVRWRAQTGELAGAQATSLA